MPDSQPTADVYLSVPGQSGAHAPFSDFIEACNALRKTLRHVERCITGRPAELELEVSELALASAKLGTSPRCMSTAQRSVGDEMFRVHSETVRSLQRGHKSLDPRLDYDALSAFEDFGPTVKRGKSNLAVDGTELSLKFLETLSAILEPVEPSLGAVSGVVEQLDVHGKCTFVLFPPVPGHEVKCSIDPKRFEEVRAAVRRHVTVYGTLHYGLGRPFPVKVAVDDIELEPDDGDLPSLLDMDGMLEHEGIEESTSVIRSLRDEWE